MQPAIVVQNIYTLHAFYTRLNMMELMLVVICANESFTLSSVL